MSPQNTPTWSYHDLTAVPVISIWSVLFVPLTSEQVLYCCRRILLQRQPHFFITANLHFMMLVERDPELLTAAKKALFVVPDGAPLLWTARLQGDRFPERVTGSDNLPKLIHMAEEMQQSIYIVGGGPPGSAEKIIAALHVQYPQLHIKGSFCPPFGDWTIEQEQEILQAVQVAAPDVLLMAVSMPRGEKWLAKYYRDSNVPLSVNVGAAFDFLVGNVRRAPKWMRKTGLEWFFRFLMEPRRLFGRYFNNGWFLLRKWGGMLFTPKKT